MSQVQEIWRQLVAFNAIADHQNKQILAYISDYLSSYDFIILGPDLSTSHQKNEYVSVDSLETTVTLYKLIIGHYTHYQKGMSL